jgi:hypothetical protein
MRVFQSGIPVSGQPAVKPPPLVPRLLGLARSRERVYRLTDVRDPEALPEADAALSSRQRAGRKRLWQCNLLLC